MQKQLPSIQFLRGLAALAVVVFHFSSGYLSEGNGFREIGRYGTYGVHIFFVISGFILPYSLYHGGYEIKHYGKFIMKRLLRLEPAYLFCLFIIVGLGYLSACFSPFGTAKTYSVDWLNMGMHIGYLIPFKAGENWLNPVFWTLAVEFQFYLFIGLAFPLLIVKQLWPKVLFILVFGVLGIIFPQRSFFFNYNLLFLSGIALFYWKEKLLPSKAAPLLLLLLLLTMCFQYDWIIALVVLFTAWVIHFTNINTPLSNFLGDISYPLYLFHNPVGALVVLHSAKQFVKGDLAFSGLILLAIVICIVFSRLVFVWIERPFIRYSKQIKY